MKELTLYELRNTQGGLLFGAPPRFIVNMAIAAGRSIRAFCAGFKHGSEFL